MILDYSEYIAENNNYHLVVFQTSADIIYN